MDEDCVETVLGDDLIRLFREEFNRRVSNSPGFDFMCLHVLVGQLPNVKRLRYLFGGGLQDLRVHGCLFQPSGSTKGSGFSFMNELCGLLNKKLYMCYYPISDFTANGLLGEWEKKKGGYVFHPGILHPDLGVSIVACNEASSIFDNSRIEHNRNVMHYLQISMNPMGSADNMIRRRTGVAPGLEFNSDVSLLLTTYLPVSLSDVVVGRGFLQRMFVVPNRVSVGDRLGTMKGGNHLLGLDVGVRDLGLLVDSLVAVDGFYGGVDFLGWEAGCSDYLDLFVEDIGRSLEGVHYLACEKLLEFAPRFLELCRVLAFHRCVLRCGLRVCVDDVVYAEDVLKPIWGRLVVLMERGLVLDADNDKMRFDLFRLVVACVYKALEVRLGELEDRFFDRDGLLGEELTLLEGGWVGRYLVYKECGRHFLRGKPTVASILDDMVERGVLGRRVVGGRVLLCVLRSPVLGD